MIPPDVVAERLLSVQRELGLIKHNGQLAKDLLTSAMDEMDTDDCDYCQEAYNRVDSADDYLIELGNMVGRLMEVVGNLKEEIET